MTHGGIRWHVSVHGWPLILIPVSIRDPPMLLSTFPSSRSLSTHRRWVRIGIGYRTTNASFANDNHPRRSLRSPRSLTAPPRIIILLLIPASPSVNAAPRRAKPRQAAPSRTRWGITPGKRTVPRRYDRFRDCHDRSTRGYIGAARYVRAERNASASATRRLITRRPYRRIYHYALAARTRRSVDPS